MKSNLSLKSLQFLRFVGIMEGISFLLLLLVAMPLKYLAGIPAPVRYVGWAHGILFVLFVVGVLQVAYLLRWPVKKILLAFIAAFIPYGTFLFDKKLKEDEDRLIIL